MYLSVDKCLAASVSGVQEVVSLMRVGLAEIILVQLLYLSVVVRLTESVALVLGIEGSSSLLLVGIENVGILVGEEAGTDIRLTATVDAAAGAAHDLDEGVLALAGADVVKENLGVLHAVSNSDADFHAAESEGSFLDAFEATNCLELDSLVLLALEDIVSGTESSFHNTAGYAEDNGCAGVLAQQILVELFIGKLAEEDTCALDEVAKLTGGENSVNVLDTVVLKLRSFLLELLCGTGHDGNYEDVLRIDAILLSVVALEDSTLHLVRRLAGRNVTKEIRVVGFSVVDPAGRAGGDHGEGAAVLYAAEKLGSLFHDGKVSSEVGVVNLSKAEALESSDHLAGYGSTDLHAKLFAQSCANCGSGLNNNVLACCHSCVDESDFGLLGESTGGADAYALTAHDAGRRSERTVACGSNDGCKASVLEAENAVAVCILAACYAAAAEDALAGVANDGGRDLVNGNGSLLAEEHVLASAGELSYVQKLALAVLVALLAVHGVVAEQELNGGAASSSSLGGGDLDLDTLVYGVYAGSNETLSTGSLNETYAAGTLVAFTVVKSAEGGNLIAALSGSFEYSNAVFYLIGAAFYFNVNKSHCVYLLSPCR